MTVIWKASQTDYKYLDDAPDRQVQAMQVHWSASDERGGFTGRSYGAQSIEAEEHIFAESQIVRVTENIMVNWAHEAMGPEAVQAVEDAIEQQLLNQENPPGNSTPPLEVV